MKLLRFEGLLYRGDNPSQPEEIWDYPRKRWVRYHGPELAAGSVCEVDEVSAARLKTHNPEAEHYLYYDSPPWRQASQENMTPPPPAEWRAGPEQIFDSSTADQDDDADYGTVCTCHGAQTQAGQFQTVRDVGVDKTDGRYADVDIVACRHCSSLWLRYAVEYEAFPSSGRWARGYISPERAAEIRPEEAETHLNGLYQYYYGGSYFGGERGVRSGGMRWGP